jgi:hypothetical protein
LRCCGDLGLEGWRQHRHLLREFRKQHLGRPVGRPYIRLSG